MKGSAVRIRASASRKNAGSSHLSAARTHAGVECARGVSPAEDLVDIGRGRKHFLARFIPSRRRVHVQVRRVAADQTQSGWMFFRSRSLLVLFVVLAGFGSVASAPA